jgi:hypothetical protein
MWDNRGVSGKGLLAIGLAVIAAVFLALVIQARSGDGGRKLGRAHAEHGERASYDDCAPVVDHAVAAAGSRIEDMFGAGAPTRLRAAATRLCVEDNWPTDVRGCLRGADHESALSSCVGQLPPDAHAHLMTEIERIPRAEDDEPLPDVDDPSTFGYGTVSVDAAAVPRGVPEECVEYGRRIGALAACDKLPASSRDALRRSYDQMMSAWGTMASSDTAREAMATGCREATTAMKQAMSSLCP